MSIRLLDLANACARVFLRAEADVEVEMTASGVELRNETEYGQALDILKLSLKNNRRLLKVLDQESNSQKFWKEEALRLISSDDLEIYFETVRDDIRLNYPDGQQFAGIRHCIQILIAQILWNLDEIKKTGQNSSTELTKKDHDSTTVIRKDLVVKDKDVGRVDHSRREHQDMMAAIDSLRASRSIKLDELTRTALDIRNKYTRGN